MVDIVFTGGGTAGHVTPNIALFDALRAERYSLAYIGQANNIEQKLVETEGVAFYAIQAGKLRRYIDWKNFTDLFRILVGLIQAFIHLLRLRPKVVFSKGGFVSCPVVWSAWLLRIPVVIHESDISPGLANKLAIPFAKAVCYSFPETEKYLPAEKRQATGLPIRPFLKLGDAQKGKALCGFSGGKPIVLLMGGSQGSKALNELARSQIEALTQDFQLCHLCGAGALSSDLNHHSGYAQFEYLNAELPDVLAATDIVISRSGATSLFEFLSLHKPSFLVPLPLGASRGDQILNAQSFQNQGFAIQAEEAKLIEQPELLLTQLRLCLDKSTEMIAAMRSSQALDANSAVISQIKRFL